MAKDRKVIRHKGDLFQSRAGYAFISPAFLVLVLMVVYPLIYGIVISFFDTNLVNKFDFVGLKYYGRLIKAAIENHLKPMLVGMSPFDIEKFFHTAFIRDAWRNGAVFNTAISGIEIAMWDIIGQKLGQPVYNLLGGKLRDCIPLYANSWFDGAKTPDDFAEAAVKVVAKGFKAIKWDPLKTLPADAPEMKRVDAGIKCLEAVRKAVGDDIELFIELHGSLSYDGALRYARLSEKYNPGFIEEPMHPDDFTGYRKLAVKSNVPIAAGERYFTRFSHRALNEKVSIQLYSRISPIAEESLRQGRLPQLQRPTALSSPRITAAGLLRQWPVRWLIRWLRTSSIRNSLLRTLTCPVSSSSRAPIIVTERCTFQMLVPALASSRPGRQSKKRITGIYRHSSITVLPHGRITVFCTCIHVLHYHSWKAALCSIDSCSPLNPGSAYRAFYAVPLES